MAKKQKVKMPKGFDLKEAIKKEKDYKSNVIRRDKNSRKFFEQAQNKFPANPDRFKIGSLYLFDYFEPKTRDQLEYYDAMPCTIFFGRMRTKNGDKRILGFNIHYYPPRIRYRVLDRIMQIYKPFYEDMWADDNPSDMSYFQYMMLIHQLQKAKLDFGVHMYIPDLVGKCQLVEPKDWQKAVFTEGRFKKRTRQAIMNYWKNKTIDKGLTTRAKNAGAPSTP